MQADDLEIVDRLIRAGAKVSVATRYGVTPLTLAARNGNTDIVERLLRAGAIRTAIAGGRDRPDDGRAGRGDHGGQAAAGARCRHRRARAVPGADRADVGRRGDHAQLVGMLLEAGASPGIAGSIFADHELKPLDGGTPKAPTSKGAMTALHYAAREGALDAVRVLVEHGADLDIVDADGVNALLYATINNGHTDTAALLLEKGANPSLADTFGRTVLYAAIDLRDLETFAPHARRRRTTDRTSALELARLAIAKGAAVNAQITGALPPRSTQVTNDTTPIGATPLWRAAKSSDAESVRVLSPRVPIRACRHATGLPR